MKKAETITNINTKDIIINNNCELFQGVGEFKNLLKLRVQPGVEPVVRPPRRVPNALRSRLADKLDALVKHKIIDKRNVRNYNKTSRVKNEFCIGQNIWFKKDVNRNVWLEGKIAQINGHRSYTVIDNNNVKYVRTSFYIRPA
ncbi:hypothetical protein ACJJTC_005229 [Scirpophaga incertulas]